MQIRFSFFDKNILILIGHKSAHFEQENLISVIEEFVINKKVEYATIIWSI